MKRKWIKTFVVVILVLGLGTGGYYTYKNYKAKNTVTSSLKFDKVKAAKTNLDVTVQATGTVTGVNQVNIFSSNSGVIEQMNYKEGTAIKKGDIFCRIKDDNQQQDIQTAQNTLNQKQLELHNLENNLDSVYIKAPVDGNVKSVFVAPGDDVVSTKPAYGGMAIITVGANNELEIPIPFPQSGRIVQVSISQGATVKKGDILFKLDDESIKNSIELKKNEIEQAQSQLSFKQKNLAESTILSPIDGIVSTLNIKNGDVTPSDKAMSTVIDTSKMRIVVPVDELDIDKVKLGQKTKLTIQDIKDKTYEGTVEEISQSGKTTNNVTTFDVTVSVNNPERLKVGMNADVSIAVQSKENIIAVPIEALVQKSGKKYVMIQDKTSTNSQSSFKNTNADQSSKSSTGNKISNSTRNNVNAIPGKLVQVETGLKNQTMVEILSGITENQIVLIQLPQNTSTNKNSNAGKSASGMSGMGAGGMGGGR